VHVSVNHTTWCGLPSVLPVRICVDVSIVDTSKGERPPASHVKHH